MDLGNFMKRFAGKIGGQFDEYSENKSIILIPLQDGRFQAVIGSIIFHDKYQKSLIELSSRVSEFNPEINLKKLLEENTKCCHAKFSIVDDILRVEASAFLDNVTEELLEEMIMEVATTADEWEFRLTGMDVH